MRILLLCSAFNGLSQRAWIDLRQAGHDVIIELAVNEETMVRAAATAAPDIIICPFLRERVPAEVWKRHRTIIVHPGPKGDRGPSSLDWAITSAESRWGVTAVEAVEEMDAGPIWGSREFTIDSQSPRKSSLYNEAVADAAIELIHEVVAKANDPCFVPDPLDYAQPEVRGRLRPMMRQSDREFSWTEPTEHILRRIRAADGSPGVRAALGGIALSVFDGHLGAATPGAPGTIVARGHGAVLVRTGDGALWIGHAREVAPDGAAPSVKLPATTVLRDRLADVPYLFDAFWRPCTRRTYREIGYRRVGPVGVLRFDFYNGAMSTGQCRRLVAALRHAAAEDTRVLVLEGGEAFSNGIHLNVIEAAANPEMEAWHNINAIDDVCREIITCTSQIIVTSIGGNAGAGGVMMALGADRVLLRDRVVLNPHYRTMALYGSEYWTYVLPRRVGAVQAERLTEQCLPIGADQAAALGLVDKVLSGRRDEFERSVVEYATRLATSDDYARQLEMKRAGRERDEHCRPLEAHRMHELAEMKRDIFDDRNGFAQARHVFVTKQKPRATPDHLRYSNSAMSAAARPAPSVSTSR